MWRSGQLEEGAPTELLATRIAVIDVDPTGGGGTEDRGDDRLDGGRGDDVLSGGHGYDTVTGGPGRDRLSGGPGRDRLEARDGRRDSVRCGSGRDRVIADQLDRVAADCERVSRAKPNV